MQQYRGRFAPSPTGALHFGSLIAALGSYLDAKRAGGSWLLRIEDVDEPRSVKGAGTEILRTLEKFGFQWDAEVEYQSARKAHYRDALEELKKSGEAYFCSCSRREIQGPYPGNCRALGKKTGAVRLKAEETVSFTDGIQGFFSQDLAREVGDFVILRADGYFAYQLAVVVDDFLQNVTHVVRGADLLDSTPRQILLQRRLGFPPPRYSHLPVAVNEKGEKLSKQTLAPPVIPGRPVVELCRALSFLGQEIPAGLEECKLDAFWAWATRNWDSARIPKLKAIPAV